MEHPSFFFWLLVTSLHLQVHGQGMPGPENLSDPKTPESPGSPKASGFSSILGTLKIPNALRNLPIATTWTLPPKWTPPNPGNLPITPPNIGPPQTPRIPGKVPTPPMSSMHNFQFSFKLFRQLVTANQHGNIIVSPPSLSLSLTMLGLQASPQARRQVLNGLGLPANIISNFPRDRVHEYFGKLLQSLLTSSLGCQSELSSLVVALRTQELRRQFVDMAWNSYHTEVMLFPTWLNQTARGQRNIFMKGQTDGKLAMFEQDLKISNSLILFSHLSFKGMWEEAFNSKLTHPQPFLVKRNFRVFVPFMERQGLFRIQYCPQLKSYVLQLPYTCYNTFYFIIPDKWEDAVTANVPLDKYLSTWTQPFQPSMWNLHLPRFTLSQLSTLEKLLPLLGILDVFNISSASIKGLTMRNSLLSIARMFHKAELTVDESGAKQNVKASRTLPLTRTRNFYFNKPFLTIVLGKANQVLFLGRVMNPTDKT